MAWTMQSALTYMQPAKRAGKMRDITEGLFWPITNDAHNGMNQSGVNYMQPVKSAGKTRASKSQLRGGLPLTGLKRGTRKGKEIRHLFSRALWFQSSLFVPSRYQESFSRAAIECSGDDSGRLHTKKTWPNPRTAHEKSLAPHFSLSVEIIHWLFYFSHDGQYVISGSEDHFVYIWRTQHGIQSARRDKNEFYESFSGKATSKSNFFVWAVMKTKLGFNGVSHE